MRKNTSGFTLVELLIVVVVIAILAAITIVAYNGIQNRAKYAQQVSELDKIGKAIQLWSAEKGETLTDSGSGYNSHGYGSLVGDSGSYGAVSIKDLLVNSGFLAEPVGGSAFSESSVLLAPCTDGTSSRWVVMARVSPAPSETPAEQMADSGCTNSLITLYTDPSGSYKRNIVKAY